MNLLKIFQPKESETFKKIIWGIVIFIIMLLIFQLGVFVGYRKAKFSYKWGDNYHRAFGGPRGGFLRGFEGKDFINGHGISGAIANINGNDLIIKGRDGIEKIISATDATLIKRGGTDIKLSDLKIDDMIVVIGSPKDDGTIEAKIIRIFNSENMPPAPGFLKPKGWR